MTQLRPALDVVAAVLAENEPRHRGRWRRQTVAEHLDHALAHLRDGRQLLEQGGPRAHALQELGHGATRVLMAVVRLLEGDGP